MVIFIILHHSLLSLTITPIEMSSISIHPNTIYLSSNGLLVFLFEDPVPLPCKFPCLFVSFFTFFEVHQVTTPQCLTSNFKIPVSLPSPWFSVGEVPKPMAPGFYSEFVPPRVTHNVKLSGLVTRPILLTRSILISTSLKMY